MKSTLRCLLTAAMTATVNAALLGLLAGSLHTAAAADASLQDPPRRQIVSFADLDVTRGQGISMLYRRIQAAALDVCEAANFREMQAAQATRKCASGALDRAVTDANIPGLTIYHNARAGHTASVAQSAP